MQNFILSYGNSPNFHLDLISKLKHNGAAILIAYCLLFLLPTKAIAQNNILEFQHNKVSLLSSSDQNQIDSLQEHDVYSLFGIYKLNALGGTQNNGTLQFELSHDSILCGSFLFYAQNVHFNSDEDYYWFGETRSSDEVSEDSCGISYLHLTNKPDYGFYASISLDGHPFIATELASGKIALLKRRIYAETFNACDQELEDPNPPLGNVDVQYLKNCESNCPVRILFLYTQNAKNHTPNISGAIWSAVHEANTVFNNSAINQCHVKLQVAGIEEFTFSQSNYNSNLGQMCARVAVQSLANDPTAISLRNNLKADLVFLVDGFALESECNVRGVVGTLELESSKSYSIITVQNLNDRYTFSHELGHLFSARHDNDPDAENYRGKWWDRTFLGLFNKRLYLTSVSTFKPGGAYKIHNQFRLPYYSNPYVNAWDGCGHYKSGEPTRANAYAFINEGCTVAAHEEEPNNRLYVSIEGEKFVCPCDYTHLDVYTAGGPVGAGTYSYEWRTSTDGITYSSVLSTSPNFYVQGSCSLNSTLFVKVTVSTATQSVSSIGTLKASQAPYGLPCTLKHHAIEAKSSVDISVNPNPVNTSAFIKTENFLVTGDIIYIYSTSSELAAIISVNHSTDAYELDLSRLSPGVYLLVLLKENGSTRTTIFSKL